MRKFTKKATEKVKDQQENGARVAVLEQLFNDFNRSRFQVYKMNFIRGIFFGLGSVLGGTVIIALIIWLMTMLSGYIPFLGDFFEGLSRLLESTKE